MPRFYKNEKVAYLFLDYGSYSKVGLNFLKKDEFKNKKLIYLDFFGDGEELLLGYGDKAIDIKNAVKERYGEKIFEQSLKQAPNRFDEIDNLLVLSAGNVLNNEFVVKHVRTDDDLIVDPEIMQKCFDALISYSRSI